MTHSEIKARLLNAGLDAVACGQTTDLIHFGFLVVSLGARPFTVDGQVVLAESDARDEYAVLRYSYSEDEGTAWEELARDCDPFVALRAAGLITGRNAL